MSHSKKQEKTSDSVKSGGLTPSQTQHLVMGYLCMEKSKVSERVLSLISTLFELNLSLLSRLTGRSLGSFATFRLPLLEPSSPRPDDASRNGRSRGPLRRLSKNPRKPEKLKKLKKPESLERLEKLEKMRVITRILMRLWKLHTPRMLRIRME